MYESAYSQLYIIINMFRLGSRINSATRKTFSLTTKTLPSQMAVTQTQTGASGNESVTSSWSAGGTTIVVLTLIGRDNLVKYTFFLVGRAYFNEWSLLQGFIVGKPFGCPGNKRKVFMDLGKNLGLIEMFPQEYRRYLMFPRMPFFPTINE